MIDFKYILEYFDLIENIFTEDERMIRMPCPIHKGDNPTAFSWDKEYNRWRCWSRACQDNYDVTLNGFIDAIIDITGETKSREEIMSDIFKINKSINIKCGFKRNERDCSLTEYEDLKISERQNSIHAFKWGISKKVIDKYLVGIYPKITTDRTLFPIFDTEGRIVGATGRKMRYNKNDKFPKWKHYNIKTNNILYNIHAFKKNKCSVILTEGPADVLKLETANIHNGLGLFGDNIGEQQIKILNNLGIKKIILGLDNDIAGRKATKKIGNLLKNYGYKVDVMCLDKKYNDIGETPLFLLKRKNFEIKDFESWKK